MFFQALGKVLLNLVGFLKYTYGNLNELVLDPETKQILFDFLILNRLLLIRHPRVLHFFWDKNNLLYLPMRGPAPQGLSV